MNEQAPITDKQWFNRLRDQVTLESKRPRNLTRKLTAEQNAELQLSLDMDIKVIENYKAYLQSITTPERKR